MTTEDHKLIAAVLRFHGETGKTYADAVRAIARALQTDNPETFDRLRFERTAGLTY